MATYTGASAIVKVSANTVAELKDVTYTDGVGTIPDDNINSTLSKVKAGRRTFTASCTHNWDPADTLGQNALAAGNSVSLIIYPRGDTSGDPTVEATLLVASAVTTVADESLVTIAYSFENAGSAITYGTVA